MNEIITESALRIKITGSCNRSCSFCHQEGDMETINSMDPDDNFFDCVNSLTTFFKMDRVMITGGEPTIHPNLHKLIAGIKTKKISITTNGIKIISFNDWNKLYNNGLTKVIMSIHNSNPQSFVDMEKKECSLSKAVNALKAQRKNITAIINSKLDLRINIVAYDSVEQVYNVFQFIGDLGHENNFEIRILNNLSDVENSQKIIEEFCEKLNAKKIKEERRSGSSNVTSFWKSENSFYFSTKLAYRYFFKPICNLCRFKERCQEGFYGIRVERKMDSYFVRLCLYRNDQDVLIEWNNFLDSDKAKVLRELYLKER